MIPHFNGSGVLPPFVGAEPGQAPAMMSPYVTDIVEVVERFGFSNERRAILRGFLAYRRALRDIGLVDGFQWLDGSFVEDIEMSERQRAPGDIDVVTFVRRPAAYRLPPDWMEFNNLNAGLLRNRARVKDTFSCDAFLVDLDVRADLLVDSTRYWFGLFSHQRSTYQWKGMLRVPLTADSDDDAVARLDEMEDQNEED